MHPREQRIEQYTYHLPDERIARYPLPGRDSSRLLVYGDGEITEDVYRNIAAYVPEGSLMVFNKTRVVNARLAFKKPTGGEIEVFCLAPGSGYADVQTAMNSRRKVEWECLIGGAGKWKQGQLLVLNNEYPPFSLTARMVTRTPGAFVLELEWDDETLTFAEVLHYAGKVPLPPYLNREPEPGDEEKYQTTYATDAGSVAAPTAGLHFTEGIFAALKEKTIDTAFVTLHVGAGTFRPVKSETMAGHDMHAEWIEADRNTLETLLSHRGTKIVAVGTTSMRTLESLYWIGCQLKNGRQPDWQGIAVTQWEPYEHASDTVWTEAVEAILKYMQENDLDRLVTRTSILIAPGYHYRMVDGLVTNFHQPMSTLLLLVSAFVGDDWRRIYDYALGHGFRFLSFGDGSLLWRNGAAPGAQQPGAAQ